jgi:hypothetical protein
MPDLKTYDLFISHVWRYNSEYYKLVEFINNATYFKWRNYSVPEHDPLVDPDTQVGKITLSNKLDGQIRPVNCVLVLAGMYASYSDWIEKEIKIANGYNKPIIGIKPWGQERIPSLVESQAREKIGWNTDSIISAIRKYSL